MQTTKLTYKEQRLENLNRLREKKVNTGQLRTEADKITEEETKELISKFEQKYNMLGQEELETFLSYTRELQDLILKLEPETLQNFTKKFFHLLGYCFIYNVDLFKSFVSSD